MRQIAKYSTMLFAVVFSLVGQSQWIPYEATVRRTMQHIGKDGTVTDQSVRIRHEKRARNGSRVTLSGDGSPVQYFDHDSGTLYVFDNSKKVARAESFDRQKAIPLFDANGWGLGTPLRMEMMNGCLSGVHTVYSDSSMKTKVGLVWFCDRLKTNVRKEVRLKDLDNAVVEVTERLDILERDPESAAFRVPEGYRVELRKK